jgi:apolipoprotein N-acyltransferase
LSALSGVLLALSLPSYDLWPLAWFGLAPFLLAIRGRTPREAFRIAWSGWFVFSLLVLYWIAPTISNFTSVPVALAAVILLLLCAVSAVYVAVFAALLEFLAAAGISRVVAAPVLWVAVDWVRTFFPAAFPWAFLGYSQYSVLPVIQIADLGAIYAVTALIVFVNAALVEMWIDGPRRHAGLAIATAMLVALDLGYGFVRLRAVGAEKAIGRLPVGIAQGNIPQAEKWDPDNQNATLLSYMKLSERAAEQGARVIVWPEAAVPFFLRNDPRSYELMRFSNETGAWLLVGAPGWEKRGGDTPLQYNQAWLIGPAGATRGPYDKIMLVPFGEYVPFAGMFGWVRAAVETVGEFGRGTAELVLDGPAVVDGEGPEPRPVRLGPLICYEGIFPDLVRRFVAAGADVLVNISNDAWYGRTSAPYQHLAMAAVRAVENRVPLVRSTNTGISAVVDPTGRIHDRTPLFEEAAVVVNVDLVEGGSLYTRIGDAFVYACIAGTLLLLYIRYRLGSVLIR